MTTQINYKQIKPEAVEQIKDEVKAELLKDENFLKELWAALLEGNQVKVDGSWKLDGSQKLGKD